MANCKQKGLKTWFKRVLRKVSRLDQICLKFLILRGIPYASSGIRCHKFQKDLKRAKLMFSTFLVRIYVKSKVLKYFPRYFDFRAKNAILTKDLSNSSVVM